MEKFLSTYNVLSDILVNQIIIYLRKSRGEDGETLEEVLERHEKILQDYAVKVFGARIPQENIYKEVVSGEEIDERPEIQKVFHRLNDHDIKGVLVVEPQRLTRGDFQDMGRVLDIFKYSSTLIITPVKTYDLDDKFDYKILKMELMQGNEYLDYTKTILNRGKRTSLDMGLYISSIPPFGYDREKIKKPNGKDKGYKLVINQKEAPIVKMIFELFVESMGTQELADFLNEQGYESRSGKEWNYGMVRNILENETYYGSLVWEKRKVLKRLIEGRIVKYRPKNEEYMIVDGLHEPLITKELFDSAQHKIKSHPNSRSVSNALQNPIAGLVVCTKCGRSMVRQPNTRKSERQKVRKYEIDKEALSTLLRQHKEASNLSLQSIADELGVTKHVVFAWLTPNIDKMILSHTFTDKWLDLKKLLNIKTDKFDKSILTYVDPQERKDYLMCPNHRCSTVASCLEVVENGILEALQRELEEFQYFLDNYEQEVKKTVKSNKNNLKRIDDKIAKLKTALKNARRDYNMERFTYEEYMEDKQEYEQEIAVLEKQREKYADTNQEDIVIYYKKAIPKLSHCLKEYHSIKTAKEKNELLKSIIEKVEYSKTKRLNWRKKELSDLELKLHLNI